MNRAVFLDRDGVINELIYHQEAGIIDSPFTVDQFTPFSYTGKAVGILNETGLKVVVVSNQPGVAKNNFSPETLCEMNSKLQQSLASQGAHIDGIYYCTHHPDGKNPAYRMNCDCRKPKPGLLLKAMGELEITPSHSYMVGDNLTDIAAGQAVGCTTILLGRQKCEICHLMDKEGIRPDIIVENLLQAAIVISEWEKGISPVSLSCLQTMTR